MTRSRFFDSSKINVNRKPKVPTGEHNRAERDRADYLSRKQTKFEQPTDDLDLNVTVLERRNGGRG